MAFTARMACEFNEDGKYFAHISSEGKVKVWNTLSNKFEQEFTPDYNLTSACTCLHFISSDVAKARSPKKKRRKNSVSEITEINIHLAIGTSSGKLLLYSITKGDLDYIIDSSTSQSIICLSSKKDGFVYSGVDSNILVWDLQKKNVCSMWSGGNEKIACILAIPDKEKLLTASKAIKLWDIKTKEVVKTFTGHSSQVTLLYYINPMVKTADDYFISGSKGDRLLSCWNLNEDVDGKNAVVNFMLEDIVHMASVHLDADGSTNIAATVRSGVVHVYKHVFNGKKASKPIKPKTTIQVVSDSKDKEVSPIYINAAIYRDFETLCICYGSAIVQTFEDIKILSYQKLQCLLREDINKKAINKESQVTKSKTPVVGNDVHYLSSQTSAVPTKRKNDGQQEVPMEKRLENLMLNEADGGSKVPKANNVAQLLIQGLHSKDKTILRTVLFKKDEQLIKNTIKRIPVALISPLFDELTKLIQGKTLSRQIGLIWLKNLISVHSGLLLSNPDLPALFGEVLGTIEAGLALQTPRNRLMGRLELLVSQIDHVSPQEAEDNEPALIFNDRVPSDSEDDGMEFEDNSGSDNEWTEGSSGEENNEDAKMIDSENEAESDEAMSD